MIASPQTPNHLGTSPGSGTSAPGASTPAAASNAPTASTQTGRTGSGRKAVRAVAAPDPSLDEEVSRAIDAENGGYRANKTMPKPGN